MNINIVKLATKLAEKRTVEEVLNPLSDYSLFQGYEEEDDLYDYNGEVQIYKEEIQLIFNNYYDYYIKLIQDCEQLN